MSFRNTSVSKFRIRSRILYYYFSVNVSEIQIKYQLVMIHIMLTAFRACPVQHRLCIYIHIIFLYTNVVVIIYYMNERTDVSSSINSLCATTPVREWNTYRKIRNKSLCVQLSSLGHDVKKSLLVHALFLTKIPVASV